MAGREAEVWTLAIGLALVAVHLAAPTVRVRLEAYDRVVGSLAGGMAAAYVFLQLLPEIEMSHEPLGEGIHGLMLLGFAGFYLFERAAGSSRITAEGGGGWSFQFHLGAKVLYNALILYTLQESLDHSPLFLVLYATAVGLHLLSTDCQLAEKDPAAFRGWGRHLLNAALVTGWVLASLTETSEAAADSLLAVLGGWILFEVFKEEVPDPLKSSAAWFLGGAVLFALLLGVAEWAG